MAPLPMAPRPARPTSTRPAQSRTVTWPSLGRRGGDARSPSPVQAPRPVRAVVRPTALLYGAAREHTTWTVSLFSGKALGFKTFTRQRSALLGAKSPAAFVA